MAPTSRNPVLALALFAALLSSASVASGQEVAPSAISLTGPSAPAAPSAAPPVNAAIAPGTSAAPAVAVVAVPSAGLGPAPKEAPPDDAQKDHDSVVHHIGVGYFGVSQLPVGQTGGTASGTVNAPVIGLRYWLSRAVGVDFGLGFGYAHNGTNAGGTGPSSTSDTWGFALHAGLPLSLGSSRHFSFELVPLEATFGFAGGSAPANLGGGGTIFSLTGFRVDVGARIGAELQFGFIGIPQLALEGSIGLYVQHESWGASVGTTGTASEGGNTTTFATSVGSDPWAIFTDTISALYYF